MFGISPFEILILAFFAFASIATWVIFRRAISRAARSGAEAAIAQQDAALKTAAAPAPTPLAAAPQLRFPDGAGRHALIAGLLFVVLMFSAPMAWLLFGQAGMPLVRLATIGVLLASLYAIVALAAMVITTKPSAANGLPRGGPMPGYDPAMQVDMVARITQRFCPRCRAPLAADAPEGLCPACLMAGGLASAAALDPANGMAVTTPPSGSQPQAAGDWTDLARHFPQLEVLELLGRGGMGAVYKARQKNLDRFVALKVIPPEAAKDPTFAERFAREARALARLNHPNIVTVYDFGQVGDVYYLLMEYVDGVNLRHAQQASRLQPQEALAIVPQICDALQYAHDQGVVHRDIKPENILLDRLGRVKIADFGLAKMLGKGPDDFTLTGAQQVMGTPRYMAPEQIEKPTTVDHRADIYSLGVVLYEMLTGELPIGHFQPPSHKVQIDVRIDGVVLRALEKEPERRYQRASQVKTDLASAAPPAWHTPAPAFKQPQTTTAVEAPLGQVLAVAIGMVLGVLLMAGGLAAGIYGLIAFPTLSSPWWGCVGAAFGCIVGGFGSVAGSYNTYRQMAGAEDLMKSPRTTWFDWTIRGYLAFGLALLACGLAALFEGQRGLWQPLLTFAVIVVFQAGLFLIYRVLLRPAALPYGTPVPLASPEPLLPAFLDAFGTGAAWLRDLSRSKNDLWLGGVCGGLGRSTPIPAWSWRMLFLVLIFGYGVGVLAYVILWICLPEAKGELPPPPAAGPVSAWLRRMSRSRQDVMLGGVCGGLGENTPLPSWSWRVLFVVLTLAYGVGVIPYVLLWICLPEAPQEPLPEEKKPPLRPLPLPSQQGKSRGNQVVLIAAGVLGIVVSLGVCLFTIAWFTSVHSQMELTSSTVRPPVVSASNQDFGRLLKSLRSETHDPSKVSFIKLVSRDNTFTSDETRQLLKEFSFDPGREEAAILLYPRVTDPKNFFLALTAFDYNPSRQSVIQRLELDRPPKPTSEQPGDALSRQEFDKLHSAVKKESFDEGRLALIKVVSQSGVFTCEQARQLLKAFSFDPGTSGREEAAVAMYPRLADPQNFYTVLEAMEFDANRNSVRRRLKLD